MKCKNVLSTNLVYPAHSVPYLGACPLWGAVEVRVSTVNKTSRNYNCVAAKEEDEAEAEEAARQNCRNYAGAEAYTPLPPAPLSCGRGRSKKASFNDTSLCCRTGMENAQIMRHRMRHKIRNKM